MLTVLIQVHVKPDSVDVFQAATLANARQSRQEPGVVRFELYQQQDDPTRFTLVEIYRGADAQAQHKETAHYATWRDAVAPMMAEPRTGVKYSEIT